MCFFFFLPRMQFSCSPNMEKLLSSPLCAPGVHVVLILVCVEEDDHQSPEGQRTDATRGNQN